MINKIGIMQGRVIPSRLDVLQLFPEDTWLEELAEINSLGFDTVELLYDKDLILDNLLISGEAESLLKSGQPNAYSVCLDYFTDFDFNADNSEVVWKKLVATIKSFADSQVKILVLPVLTSKTSGELSSILKKIKQKEIDLLCNSQNMAFALEINIPAIDILGAFGQASIAHVGICYDFGNSRANGRIPEEEIFLLKDLIMHVHVKDTDTNCKNVILGEGRVELGKCFQALKDFAYPGHFVLETAYFEDPKTEACKNLNTVKAFLGED